LQQNQTDQQRRHNQHSTGEKNVRPARLRQKNNRRRSKQNFHDRERSRLGSTESENAQHNASDQ
jgi:hypothetical protein